MFHFTPELCQQYQKIIRKHYGVIPAAVEDKQCRWPIGDPRDKDFKFCGCPISHKSYCQKHAELAYQSQKEKRG